MFVCIYELHICLAFGFLSLNILSGKEPVLFQNLLLKPPKCVFNCFRLTVVWCGISGNLCQLSEKALSFEFFCTALVIEFDFKRLVSGNLQSHFKSVILCFVIFFLADMITEKNFAVCIKHFIYLHCFHIAVFVLIVVIQLCTVRVPKRISHTW